MLRPGSCRPRRVNCRFRCRWRTSSAAAKPLGYTSFLRETTRHAGRTLGGAPSLSATPRSRPTSMHEPQPPGHWASAKAAGLQRARSARATAAALSSLPRLSRPPLPPPSRPPHPPRPPRPPRPPHPLPFLHPRPRLRPLLRRRPTRSPPLPSPLPSPPWPPQRRPLVVPAGAVGGARRRARRRGGCARSQRACGLGSPAAPRRAGPPRTCCARSAMGWCATPTSWQRARRAGCAELTWGEAQRSTRSCMQASSRPAPASHSLPLLTAPCRRSSP